MVSTPSFRQSLKRASSSRLSYSRGRFVATLNAPAEENSQSAAEMSSDVPNGSADERSPLLHGRENVGASNDNGGEASAPSRKCSSLAQLFFDAHHTPGQENANNYVNVLLIFVPLGIVAGYLGWSPTAVFILNFFAIVPLAAVLSFATEEISAKVGETIGGLLNATFGNAVELIVSIVALRNDQIRIVQSSMLGSILSNVLLVLGCCFLAGGIHNSRTGTVGGIEQNFNSTVASTMSSLMTVASASLIIPATLYAVLAKSTESSESHILFLSHGTAIILLFLYILFLFFQLKTHSALFDAEQALQDDEEEEAPPMSPWAAAVVLLVVTVGVAVCAEYLVGSIDELVKEVNVSKTFIGLILLPIVGNAAEHVTAVVVALKDKMDLAMGVAIGSSLQIALLVTPLLVILGWIWDKPMTLHFETFETVVFFLSVLVVTYVIQDGKSNYFEGVMLLGMYIIIALAFLVYPDDATDAGNAIRLAVRGWVMGGGN